MKRTGLYATALLCATLFCGCTATQRVTSYGVFDNTVKEVVQELEREGFTLVDVERDKKTEQSLWSRSHDIDNVPSSQSAGEVVQSGSSRYGFQGNTTSDHVYTDIYRFANSEGETMSYAVSYRTGIDLTKGFVFLKEVYTSGCETSNPALHDRLCGEHSPIHRLDSMEKDTTAVL